MLPGDGPQLESEGALATETDGPNRNRFRPPASFRRSIRA